MGVAPREVVAIGTTGFLARFATEDDAADWAAATRHHGVPGISEIVQAYRSVAVFVDPDWEGLPQLEGTLRGLVAVPREGLTAPRRIEVPVYYDGADLDEVAARRGLARTQVVHLHSREWFTVFAIGFLPGFPYAGYLPEPLRGLPRRSEPRARVPAGSVAIAGSQTGIYPRESPGGWHLLGRTPLTIVDVERGLFPIQAGDRVRFVPIDRDEFEARRGEMLCPIPG